MQICFLLLPSVDTHRFQTLSVQYSHINFVLPVFLILVGFPEILSLRSYHQIFLPDDQPILVFLFYCC